MHTCRKQMQEIPLFKNAFQSMREKNSLKQATISSHENRGSTLHRVGGGVGVGNKILPPPPLFSDLQYTYIIHAILFYVIKIMVLESSSLIRMKKKNEELINARSIILVSLHLHDVDVNQMIYTTCMSASNYNNLEYIIIIICRE